MNKKILITGLLATAVNLLLNAGTYFIFLDKFYQSHPVVSQEFMKQLHRQPNQLIGWALAISALTMGFLITIIIKWSGAKTFAAGLKYGCIIGLLFWSSVNFGIYASSNHFSQATVFVDLVFSATAMAIAAAVAAWVLGRGKTG